VLVGNKCDLIEEAQITIEDADEWSKEVGAELCIETSAKEGTGIQELFAEIGLRLYKRELKRLEWLKKNKQSDE